MELNLFGSSSNDSDDDSEQNNFVIQKVKNYKGKNSKLTPWNGINSLCEIDSEPRSEETDDPSSLQKAAPMSPEFKKRKEGDADCFSKNEELSKVDWASSPKIPKPANASEDKSKAHNSNSQQKRSGKQHDVFDLELKREEPLVQSKIKGSQNKASLHKRKHQDADLKVKARKAAQTWSRKDELLLASQFLRDMKNGVSFPLKQNASYWDELHEHLTNRLETSRSKIQISDKYRYMKRKYAIMNERLKREDPKLHKYNDAEEEELFKVFQQLWGNEIKESKQMLKQKSRTPSSEKDDTPTDEEDAATEERKPHIANERYHKNTDKEETGGEDGHGIEQSAKKKSGKDVKRRKVPPCREVNHNRLWSEQIDAHPSDHKNWSDKLNVHGNSMIHKVEFDKALEASSSRNLEDLQNKFLEICKQEQAKIHAMLEKLVKDFDEIFWWLSELVTMSLERGSTAAFLPRLLGGFPRGYSSEGNELTSLFDQEWQGQQVQEVQINIKRIQLMQEIVRTHLKEKTHQPLT